MHVVHAYTEIRELPGGEVLLLPTDTVYGLSCAVQDVAAVEKIKALKYRDAEKPLIVLIATLHDLERFGIVLTPEHTDFLKRVWPGPVSVVFKGVLDSYSHISTQGTLAVRMPMRDDLRAFIARVGAIVSTSANRSGERPATTIGEAAAYFPEGIAIAVDTGVCAEAPSTVVQILR